MSRLERQQSVLELLKHLRGLDPLKKLFWSELNYQRVNQSLSRRGWPDSAAGVLADDPVFFAGGGQDEAFHVIYARLASGSLRLGDERPVVSRLLKDHPYALFAFSNSSQDHWHFLNVKYDDKAEKRRLFRRITIGPGERLRTTSERLTMLDLADLSDTAPLTIQERHDEAFDVEAVQKVFFKIFAELYHKVVQDISNVHGLEKEARKLAQLLLDRMLFLYFIQKKGWLNQRTDYLYARFQDCWRSEPKGHSYYSNVLYPLFLCLSNADMKMDNVGAVPFLNGGLFEESTKQTQATALMHARLRIKNTTFKAIFDDLLERFNFTVTEDTPLDVEVAIDPEMLGKIFESLILQLEQDPDKDLRKLTGSYYTPRPIVHFMCQEALKEYLVNHLAHDDEVMAKVARERVSALLTLPPADHLDDEQLKTLTELFSVAEAAMLRHAILDCRICDPAVGSGAFPVGMLHEMVAVVARLDLRLHDKDYLGQRNYDYDLKKQIIECCLYGVDIQEQAIRLCELRLWLSLVVDYQLDPSKPFIQAICEVPCLPNLSYRIMRGDSLLERLFGHVVQLDEMAKDAKTKQLIESIQADKQAYFREGKTAEKRRIEIKILVKQADLAERLIEAKHAAKTTYQTNIFGEVGMTAKERKAKANYDAQTKELADLKKKVSETKAELERLTRLKETVNFSDLDMLRRKYFHAGTDPTFIWRLDFAEIFEKKGGFDIVIENPPYIRVQRLDHKVIDALMRNYVSAYKKLDTSVVFIERSMQLTNAHGSATIISSSQWMKTDYGARLRQLITRSRNIRKIVDFGSLPVFEDVSTYPAIIFLSTKGCTNPGYSKVDSVKTFKAVQFIPPVERSIEFGPDEGKPWILEKVDLFAYLQEKRIRWIPLSDVGHFFIGLLTGMDSVFVLTAQDAKALGLETKYLFPYAYRGAEINRYEAINPNSVVIYPYRENDDGTSELLTETQLKSEAPRIYKHLKERKTELKKRKDSRRFYAGENNWFCNVRPGRFSYIRPRKLIIKGIANRSEVGILTQNTTFNGANCPAFIGNPPDYYVLLACLNSSVVSEHLRSVCPPKLQGYSRFNANNLNEIPLPASLLGEQSSEDRLKIEMMVKKRMGLSGADGISSELEKHIDEIVKGHYGSD